MSLTTATPTANTSAFTSFIPAANEPTAEINALPSIDTLAVYEFALQELQAQMKSANRSAQTVAMRIAKEVERICQKSDRGGNCNTLLKFNISNLFIHGDRCISELIKFAEN
ncbi:hypothetical protein HC766_07010 [Candidatus Gracilibacteria bacterium]|nr:hypothetical protein [Candidatus Gracilibacteria bacterium]